MQKPQIRLVWTGTALKGEKNTKMLKALHSLWSDSLDCWLIHLANGTTRIVRRERQKSVLVSFQERDRHSLGLNLDSFPERTGQTSLIQHDASCFWLFPFVLLKPCCLVAALSPVVYDWIGAGALYFHPSNSVAGSLKWLTVVTYGIICTNIHLMKRSSAFSPGLLNCRLSGSWVVLNWLTFRVWTGRPCLVSRK